MLPPSPRRRPRAPRSSLVALAGAVTAALVLSTGATFPTASASPHATASTAVPAAASASAAADDLAARKRSSFKAASFNILGSFHTEGPGGYASGVKRARMAKKWLVREGTSVLGMTEAQRDQIRVLTQGGTFASWPPRKTSSDTETAQSVVWRTATWKFVRGKRFTIPFNYGNSREQPMVMLKNRDSGRRLWVVSVHLQNGSNRQAKRERRVGMARMIKNVKRLQRSKPPVLLTGDMNSRRTVFCRTVKNTALDSPMGGGTRNGRCHPPSGMRIDWIFGSKPFDWSGFRYADGPVIDKITDHTVPVATVRR